MEGKAVYRRRIRAQLSKWKKTLDSLTEEIERSEGDVRVKLGAQRDSLRDKQARGERLLETLAAGSPDWEDLQSEVEQRWREITRPEKPIRERPPEVREQPDRDEEIRRMAYHLWLDEGCPHGRDREHWFQAEYRWREQQSVKRAEAAPRAKTAAKRKSAGSGSRSRRRSVEPSGSIK